MNKNTKIIVAVASLSAVLLLGMFLYLNYFQGGNRVYNVNTGLSYSTIQTAINAPETKNGHTLIVYPGVYRENIVISKTLTVRGYDVTTTIIDIPLVERPLSTIAMLIQADNTTVANLTVQNSHFGIWTLRTKGAQITDNKLVNCTTSIKVDFASETIVRRNRVLDGTLQGILLYESFNNTVTQNEVKNVKIEVFNQVEGDGIHVERSRNNTVTLNQMDNNANGIRVYNSSDNLIHHNNFLNNTKQLLNLAINNEWDSGYPSGGNYWSDYTGTDVKSGASQDQPGSDGIGDTPYIIDSQTEDRYPLMQKVNIDSATS